MSIHLDTTSSSLATTEHSSPSGVGPARYGFDPLDAVYCSVCGCEAGVCAGTTLHGADGSNGLLRPVAGPAFNRFSPVPWAIGFSFMAVALMIGL